MLLSEASGHSNNWAQQVCVLMRQSDKHISLDLLECYPNTGILRAELLKIYKALQKSASAVRAPLASSSSQSDCECFKPCTAGFLSNVLSQRMLDSLEIAMEYWLALRWSPQSVWTLDPSHHSPLLVSRAL